MENGAPPADPPGSVKITTLIDRDDDGDQGAPGLGQDTATGFTAMHCSQSNFLFCHSLHRRSCGDGTTLAREVAFLSPLVTKAAPSCLSTSPCSSPTPTLTPPTKPPAPPCPSSPPRLISSHPLARHHGGGALDSPTLVALQEQEEREAKEAGAEEEHGSRRSRSCTSMYELSQRPNHTYCRTLHRAAPHNHSTAR